MYILLVDNDISKYDTIVEWFNKFLNIGHTYESIRSEVLNAFYNNQKFNIKLFNNPYVKEDKNLLEENKIYYHNELKITPKLPVVVLDINQGTMTNRQHEHFLERRASYTIKDLVRYFYSRNMADVNEYNYYRMRGFLLHKINQYGLEITLFIIEAMYRDFLAEKKMFNMSHFDSYLHTARTFFDDCKNNSEEPYYVQRKRNLIINH